MKPPNWLCIILYFEKSLYCGSNKASYQITLDLQHGAMVKEKIAEVVVYKPSAFAPIMYPVRSVSAVDQARLRNE